MLAWLLGGERSQNDQNVDKSCEDVPDTPAPTFVARAFKTALFGTPAPPETQETEFSTDDNTQKQSPIRLNSDSPFCKNIHGILLTPGTATTLRKTVSFDNDVDERKKSDGIGTRNQKPIPSVRKTSLTQQFEKARSRKPMNEAVKENLSTIEEKSSLIDARKTLNEEYFDPELDRAIDKNNGKKVGEYAKELRSIDDERDEGVEGDMTTDLNKPRSQSGKYWKSEFEKYHYEARLEMRKLLSYKELAKSFAKIKDEQSINLAEKLKEEQQKVIAMEEIISSLSASIKLTDEGGVKAVDETRILIKELARQTARAVQYKEQVEEFRKLMEKIEPCNPIIEREATMNFSLPGFEHQINVETKILISQMRRDIKHLSKKVQEMVNLEAEHEILQKKTREQDKIIERLEDEKEELRRCINQLEVQLSGPKDMLCSDIPSRAEKCNNLTLAYRNSQLDRRELKNLPRLEKYKTENFRYKSRNQVPCSANESITSKFSPEKPEDLQYLKELNKYKNDHISRHHDNATYPLKPSLQKEISDKTQKWDLEEVTKKNQQSATQTSNLYSKMNIKDKQNQSSRLPKSPPRSSTRPQFAELRFQIDPNDLLISSKEQAEVTKSAEIQDRPITCSLAKYQHSAKILPNHSLPEVYTSTPYSQNIELKPFDKNLHLKNFQDSYRSKLKISSSASSPPELAITQKKSDEDLNRSIDSSKLGHVERKSTKKTLPAEKVEAAKKRLAEKKRLRLLRQDLN